MSVSALCKGDRVVVQTEASTIGESMGVAESYTDGATYDCLVQTPSAEESTKYATRGMRLTHWVFFAQDVGLDTGKRLKWTVRANAALSAPMFLRVLDYYAEGRPGADMLWVADCEWDQTKQEA